jgi:hypothetical protein
METLNVLSEVHARRFEHTGALDDLDKAFHIQLESVDALHIGHGHRAQALFGLARLCLSHNTSRFDIRKALDLAIEAVRDNNGSALPSLKSALDVLSSLEIAAQRPSFCSDDRLQLFDFYQHIIALIPRVACFGLDLESRLRALAKVDNISTAAATHAVMLGHIESALEVLEEGRGVFWTQALRLRIPLDGLPDELAEKLDAAARRLENGTSKATKSTEKAKAAIEEDAVRMRQLSEEFDSLIAEVRNIPEYSRFLLPEQFSALSAVADHGPVIVLLSGQGHCAAIILRDSTPP